MTNVVSSQEHDPAAGGMPSRVSRVKLAKMIGFFVAVVVASAFLVPRGVELAGLRTKSGQAESALRLLETAYAEGDHSVATMNALARHRARSGNVAGGIELLRALTERSPDDVPILEALAKVYDQARRPSELTAVLERLQQLAPDVERQRRLARIYGEQNMLREQAAALSGLVERFDAGDVADRLLLARLQAQHGEHARALATFERMVERFPQSHDASVVAAQLAALLGGGDAAGALARARARLEARPQAASAEAPVLAGALMVAGKPSLAVDLLAPLVAVPQPDSYLLATWAQAMSDAGRPGEALAHMEDGRADSGDTALQTLRLNLALAVGRPDSALAAVRALGVGGLSAPALSRVAALALSAGHKEAMRHLRDTADSVVGQHDSLLAARIAQALGERAATVRWGRAAANQTARTPAEALQLVRLLHQAGELTLASDVLRQTAAPFDQPDLLAEYPRLHIALGSAATGLAEIEKAMSKQASVAMKQAWALLATASGRHNDVLRWLQASGSARADETNLKDIYHLAMDGKAYELAVASAERLLAQSGPNDGDRLLLVHALMPSGRAADAAAHLRILRQQGKADEVMYAAALLAAWRRGEPVNGELRRIYADRLARGPQSATREADVFMLLELGAHAEAVKALEELTVTDPERWLSTYLEAATKAGQGQQTVFLLGRWADTPTLPASLRSQLAFRLLEAGDKAAVERTFQTLASNTGPRDAATQRLLFVWGPRPTQPQLEWLEARALEAKGQERAVWMRLLNERGAAGRAIAVYRKTVWPSPDGDAVLEAYLEALAVSGDQGLLASTLQEMASRTRSGGMLARLAREAAAAADAPMERRLLEAALSAGNSEPTLRRALGLLAYRTRDLRAAELHLTAFNERAGGDVDTYRALGELRLLRGDAAAAKASFEQAILALERRPDASFEGRMTKAGLLDRLRRPAEARRLYEELLTERPNDGNVRADYVAMLMDLGESRSAQALLEAR